MGNCCSSCRPRKKAAPYSGENKGSSIPAPTNETTMESSLAIIATKSDDEGRRRLQASTAPPSISQYYIRTGKKTVQILQTAAQFAPVPLVKDALDVVLKLIEVCETVTDLQEQLEDLKNRLGSLGLIIFDLVESGSPPKTTLEARIAKLRDDLGQITIKLQAIGDQSKMALALYTDLNKESIKDCVKRITFALDEFHLSHAISTEGDLRRILEHLEDMSSQLKHVDEGVQEANRGIEEIKALMKNTQSRSAIPFSPSGMPAQLAHFRGRHGMVTTIGDGLCSNDPQKNRVAILGAGGMGKTSLAVEVMESDLVKEKFDSEHRFWVSCKGATSFAIFMQILATSLRVKTDLGDLRRDIHIELAVSDAPRVIVLDNFETPWGTSEQSDVESVLCDLAKLPHVAILITMRSNNPPSDNIAWHSERLRPVDPNASRQIYTDIDPLAVGHEALDELLMALGHMPYAIKLIATLGKESESRPDTLLRMWMRKGTAILGKKNEMDRSISLSVESDLMQSHPEARSLLVTLSMLPAGTTSDHLDWWTPGLIDDKLSAIAILNRTALISKVGEQASPTWLVYPVVQRYMEHTRQITTQDQIRLQETAFSFILDHKSSPGDPTFKDDRKVLVSEDVNLRGILTSATVQRVARNYVPDQLDEIRDSKLLDSLLAFSFYQLWSKPVLDIAQLAIRVARHLGSKIHLAEGLNCLGQTYHHLANFEEAVVALKEARSLFTSLSMPLRSAQTAYLFVYSCGFLDRQSRESELDTLETDVHAVVESSDTTIEPQLRAVSLITIGNRLWSERQHKKALEYLRIAQETFASLGHSFEAAHCLFLVGTCCISMQDYSKAMDACKLAVQEFNYLGLDASKASAWGLEGYCLLKLQKYHEALNAFQACLQEDRRLGKVLATAQDLEFIAQVFEQKGDVSLVKLGYESALEQYKIVENTPMGKEGKERCEHNLSALDNNERGEGDEHSVMPWYLQHLFFF